MATSGSSWSAWGYVTKSSSNWNDQALGNGNTHTSDVIDLNGKMSGEYGIKLYEDDTGAISGDVTVKVLRATGDDGGGSEEYEDATNGSPLAFLITPVQNATVRKAFTIDALDIRRFKIAVTNNAGQELAVTVEERTSQLSTS